MTTTYKKVIACLDIKDGRVVKGVNFVGLKDAGDPIEIAKKYSDEGVDELVFLDICATTKGQKLKTELIKKVINSISIPLTVGGGIKNIEDIEALIKAGVSKVSIGSAAIKNPSLIQEASKKFGKEKIVAAIDAKKDGNSWEVYFGAGKEDSGLNLLEWVKEVETLGAGEILLTSMDKDGVKDGYDLKMLKAVSKEVDIPIVASGGAGEMEHFKDAFLNGAEAALAASVFHFQKIKIKELKSYLKNEGFLVKI